MTGQVSIQVFGKVQGVWFRASTRSQAQTLGLSGFVMNMSDGSVMIEAMGDIAALEKLIRWCYEGPELARVDEVRVQDILRDQWPEGFEVRRG